jgi:hypothetical protein
MYSETKVSQKRALGRATCHSRSASSSRKRSFRWLRCGVRGLRSRPSGLSGNYSRSRSNGIRSNTPSTRNSSPKQSHLSRRFAATLPTGTRARSEDSRSSAESAIRYDFAAKMFEWMIGFVSNNDCFPIAYCSDFSANMINRKHHLSPSQRGTQCA